MTDSQAAETILIISDSELPLDREQFSDPPPFSFGRHCLLIFRLSISPLLFLRPPPPLLTGTGEYVFNIQEIIGIAWLGFLSEYRLTL